MVDLHVIKSENVGSNDQFIWVYALVLMVREGSKIGVSCSSGMECSKEKNTLSHGNLNIDGKRIFIK
jgi:hypothetical protein